MPRDQSRFLARLWAMEDALVKSGLKPMPEWWRRQIARFYQSGKRWLVVRKGRRVFASTCVAPRLAVAEMLFGEHEHTPGSPPLEYVFLSVKRDEAANRLIGVTEVLDRLGVKYGPGGEQHGRHSIVLAGRPAVFRVVTVRANTAVGGTVAFAWCDEVSRWNDDKTGKNPAELVIGSFAPALATMPNAPLFLVSSPFSVNDYHAKAFDRGDTARQMVAFGNTWTINPTLTEEKTRELEPDHATWLREYAAIPSETVEDNWFGEAIDRAVDDDIPRIIPPGVRPIVALDPAFDPSTPDKFGWAVITSEPRPVPKAPKRRGPADPIVEVPTIRPGRLTLVRAVGAWDPDRSPLELAKRVRTEVLDVYDREDPRAELKRAYSDQFEGYSFAEVAKLGGINLDVVKWTGGTAETSKFQRFKAVRLAMLAGDFKIPNDPDLIRELRQVKRVLSASGNERIELPRDATGHCDRVAAVVLGGSIALLRPPTAAIDTTPPKQEDLMREQALREAEARKRKQSQTAAGRYETMRKVFGGGR